MAAWEHFAILLTFIKQLLVLMTYFSLLLSGCLRLKIGTIFCCIWSLQREMSNVIIENLRRSGLSGVIDIFLSVTDSFAALPVKQARSMCIRITFVG